MWTLSGKLNKYLLLGRSVSLLFRESPDVKSTSLIGHIFQISEYGGTRTLIRGKRRHHPFMFEPSQSLLRADRIHHLFSIAVSMRPSPDWFLGTSEFELCGDDEWLPWAEIPLFPWDAGTMDGISYEVC